MNFFEVVKRRRSIHSFTKEEVSDEDVTTLLEAARRAPTAGNVQPWRFVVVRNHEMIERLIAAAVPGYSMNFVRKAPVVIVVCADLNLYKQADPRSARRKSAARCICRGSCGERLRCMGPRGRLISTLGGK